MDFASSPTCWTLDFQPTFTVSYFYWLSSRGLLAWAQVIFSSRPLGQPLLVFGLSPLDLRLLWINSLLLLLLRFPSTTWKSLRIVLWCLRHLLFVLLILGLLHHLLIAPLTGPQVIFSGHLQTALLHQFLLRTTPTSPITVLLTLSQLRLDFALTFVFALVVLLGRWNSGSKELGKLDCGLVQLWTAWCPSLALLPKSLRKPWSTLSFVLLPWIALLGYQLLLSTSVSFLPLHRQAPSHIRSLRLLKQESTVPGLGLPYPISNDDYVYQDDRLRELMDLHPDVALGGSGGGISGSFCCPSDCSAARGHPCCPHGFHSCSDFGERCCCRRNRPGGPFDNGPGSCCPGVRRSRGSFGGEPHSLYACRLLRGCGSNVEGIRPSYRWPPDPAFLARPAGDFSFIDFPSGKCIRVDHKRDRLSGPFLLCCGRGGVGDPCGDQEETHEIGCTKAEEGHYSSSCRSTRIFDRVSACHHQSVDCSSPESREVGGCIGASSRCSPSGSAPSAGLSGPSFTRWDCGSGRFCESRGNGSAYQAQHSFETADGIRVGRGRAFTATRPGGLQTSSQCEHGPVGLGLNCSGFGSAESGHDSFGSSLDKPGDLRRFKPIRTWRIESILEGDSKKREAADGASESIRRLHAQRCADSFQEDETYGCGAFFASRFQRQIALYPLLREARRLHGPEGSLFGPVDDGSHSRCFAERGLPWSSRTMCFGSGSNRSGIPRLWEMGCGLDPQFVGGPPAGDDEFQRKTNQSEAGCLLTNLPTGMGYNIPPVYQRDGPDSSSTIRGCWSNKEGSKVRRGGRSTSTQTSSSLSEEAQAERDLLDPGGSRSSCNSSNGFLCSGSSTCQGPSDANLRVDGGLDSPPQATRCGKHAFWNSLQTFSFKQWCARLLREVLASKTPFAAFLIPTLQASRSDVRAPDQALFPLPFPKFGIFRPLPPTLSSRMRRRIYFDQAFHVVVAALNYLHADCSFPPLDLMIRIPSKAQRSALWNLRCLMKAFGNSGDEFLVPRSGRRSTNLIASLCDLSEFLTRSGASAEPYANGFAGAPNEDLHGKSFQPDLSLAEELVPYRQLDFSRIKMTGTGSWNPAGFLDDSLILPFLEPDVLCGHSTFDFDNLPNLEREDPNQVLGLALLWDSKGLLHIREDVIEPGSRQACMRCFNCYKDSGQDRLIGDRRGRNQLELSVAGPSRYLPTGPSLCVLELPPRCTLSICAADRKDFYHQLRVPVSRARKNALWPPLPLSLLQSTRAYDDMLARLAASKGLRREDLGDDLRNLDVAGRAIQKKRIRFKLPNKDDLVHCCFGTIAQGDHLGVEIATDSHRNLLCSHGLLRESEDLLTSRPFAGQEVLQGLVIDDFFALSTESLDFQALTSRSYQRFKKANEIYSQEGLIGSPLKDIVEQRRAKIAGAEIDASKETLAFDVAPVGAPVQKRLALSLVSLELAKLRWTSDSLHACLIGGWTSALMYRRQLMAVLFHSHHLVDSSALNASQPSVLPLPRKVAEELVLLSVLSPLMCSDLRAELCSSVFCTDSSDTKGAIVETEVPLSLGRALWRTGSKKGGYAKLINREEARLLKISHYESIIGEDHPDPPFGAPRKSPLLRFDFIEICGGAAKVSHYLGLDGWIIGPCLDLDRSEHFDLSTLDLFRWLAHLIETSRLDSFLVQPPCTTFSPAQHPALRSYQLPRGYNPTEPRTLLGSCLALRSLGLMMISARTEVIGMLEQSRRSKMAWLPEWRWLVNNGWAHEEWLASCMYGSPHQKEFRFLVTNADSSELHRKCDRQHTHIKVQGGYTKASAVYTDELAAALARCFSRELRRKKARSNYVHLETNGLESTIFNDVLVTSEWAVKDDWKWKKPAHINIHETAAVSRLYKQRAISSPKTRFSVGIDSNVALSALAKGRSPSFGLRPVLRRACCTCLAGCLYPSHHFAPTRWNTADCPTRDTELPQPSPHSICSSLSFRELLRLSQVSSLRRYASNWVRLALLLLGGRLSSWTWVDSSRFSHYSRLSYPYSWIVSVASRNSDFITPLSFDSTLGFPGEGPPRWILWICLSSPVNFLDFCRFAFIPDRAASFPCAGLTVTPAGFHFSRAMPLGSSHGGLQPRNRGDFRRAEDRRDLTLAQGRAVLPKTRDSRDNLLILFDSWLKERGSSIALLIDRAEIDIDLANRLLEEYGRQLFAAGRPYNHFSETLNAISSRRPRLRRSMQQAWNLAMAWLREEPGSHHLALPWQCLLALLTTAYVWGWIQEAGILALSWGGVTRIGEAIGAFRGDLLLPSDFGHTIKGAFLQIREPKTRFKSARHQLAKVDQPQLVAVLECAFRHFNKLDRLCPYSGQTLRSRFGKLLAALKISGSFGTPPKGLDLGSLRAGGATWLLQVSEDAEMVRRRGRWLNSRTMEIYIQECSALQFLPSLDSSTRELLLQAVRLFPAITAKFLEFLQHGIPQNAWKHLLVGSAWEVCGLRNAWELVALEITALAVYNPVLPEGKRVRCWRVDM